MIMCKFLFEAEKCHTFCITLSGGIFQQNMAFSDTSCT